MKNLVSKIAIFATLTLSVLISQQAMAGCKAEVDAAAKAEDQRNAACNSASKSLKDKTLQEIAQGDSKCKAKENKYKKAKNNLSACTK